MTSTLPTTGRKYSKGLLTTCKVLNNNIERLGSEWAAKYWTQWTLGVMEKHGSDLVFIRVDSRCNGEELGRITL